MTEAVTVALIAAGSGAANLLLNALILRKAGAAHEAAQRAADTIQKVEVTVDGRMGQLLKTVEEASFAKGIKQEKDRNGGK